MNDSESITEDELLAFLYAIEAGEIILVPEIDPQIIRAGGVYYQASNGWGITIHNDANVWDFIETVVSVDGRVLEFEEINRMPHAREYEASDEVAWERYGIPGYMRFRCKGCGEDLPEGPVQGLISKVQRGPAPGLLFVCEACMEKAHAAKGKRERTSSRAPDLGPLSKLGR